MAKLEHLVSVDQLTLEIITSLFARVDEMRSVAKNHGSQLLSGYVLASLFYEPSTRTKMSFDTAMHRLGGRVVGTESAAQFSSAVKGETLQDTIRTICRYADAIVLRHPEIGSARLAASVATKPIINAGDGAGEHPTQALLDLYTIQSELGRIDGTTVVMVGDLKYGRTVHSLARLLALYNVQLIFVSPESLCIPQRIKDELGEKSLGFQEMESLDAAIGRADVLYMTRVQKERFTDQTDYLATRDRYILRKRELDLAREGMAILHPLPRVNEIHPEIDADPRAAYFRQVENGMLVRMALLDMILRSNGS